MTLAAPLTPQMHTQGRTCDGLGHVLVGGGGLDTQLVEGLQGLQRQHLGQLLHDRKDTYSNRSRAQAAGQHAVILPALAGAGSGLCISRPAYTSC